ncbi:hypothetical protein [Alkalimarinus alittae]|uniref:Uncharacterized protein n=1 Tax=Alkalimarinus alittae TaxID=2961619 RepID=A0ABY6N3Z4_9ALTE|nr:hypothetical protein [Alkalimarinus alittae]UZE96813.1 hypothetical protein NKI27_03410 [Alkalimarinus alittae]
MKIEITLIALGCAQEQLYVVADVTDLSVEKRFPRAELLPEQNPDEVARCLLNEHASLDAQPIKFSFQQAEHGCIELIYYYLAPGRNTLPELNLIALSASEGVDAAVLTSSVNDADAKHLQAFVKDLQLKLYGAMNPTKTVTGFKELIDLLPEVFNIKDLTATYKALMGERPKFGTSLIMRLLPSYVIKTGKGEKVFEGRGLIEEFEDQVGEVASNLAEEHKDYYKKGGRRAVKVYKKHQ